MPHGFAAESIIVESQLDRDRKTIENIEAIARRVDMAGTYALGALIGVSPSTVRIALATGRLPERQQVREKFESFLAANLSATSRAAIRLVN